MRVGRELLSLARSIGARSIFVVGTGRDVGKTVTFRAIYEATWQAGITVALASIGRESDASHRRAAAAKPRLWLRPKTIFATARTLLPPFPATEIVGLSPVGSAAGNILYARVADQSFYELGGPPTASGLREVVDELLTRSEIALVDGAVDRIASLAGSKGAIIVAGGAATAAAPREAAAEIAGLVARLAIPSPDPGTPAVEVEGALTPSLAAALIASGETRQIVVHDPTQVSLNGRAAQEALARLDIRCRRPLRVIAVTISSSGPENDFEPVSFAEAVATATGLPTFDIYRGARAA